jgi:hypothetical protein
MRLYILAFSISTTALFSTPASAQYDMWAGQIQNAQQAQYNQVSTQVSGIILDNVVNGQSGSRKAPSIRPNSDQRIGQIADTRAVYQQLMFKPSKQIRQELIRGYIAQTKRGDPAAGAELEKMLATTDVFAIVKNGMAPFGMTPDNLADAYTAWMINMWSAAHGNLRDSSASQIKAVQKQVLNSLAALPSLYSMNNSDKQRIADELVYYASMISGGAMAFADDPEGMRAYQQDVRKMARTAGFDVDAVVLTENGFVPRKSGKRGDAGEAMEGAEPGTQGSGAMASAAPAPNNGMDGADIALLIAAVSAGAGGIFMIGKGISQSRG